MEFLQQLWMPIVVSSVIVFIASSIIHMALPVHKGEWKGLPDEEKVMAALEGTPEGQYMVPWGSMADMKNPEWMAKYAKGPRGQVVLTAPVNMGKNLIAMFVWNLVVGVFVAYIAWHALPPGTPYLKVFQLSGSAAVGFYCLGGIPQQVWFGGSSRAFWTYLFDGIVYGLLTAGVFGWLWPKLMAVAV